MRAESLVHRILRRLALVGAAVSLVFVSLEFSSILPLKVFNNSCFAAENPDLQKWAEAANKEGVVVWYESSPENQVAKIAAAFNKRYPKIKIQHVRLRGSDPGVRIIAESQAGGPTADVCTTGFDTLMAVDKRGFLERPDWTRWGIEKDLVATPYGIVTTASTYCLVYNTNLVSAADAPKNWDDMLDLKWKGKTGIWKRTTSIANLVNVWGEKRTLDFAKGFAALNPVIYQSNFPLNNAVAAGEISVGISIYHTAVPALRKGAPLKVVFTDPTSVTFLGSSIPKMAPHPNAARAFVVWLHSLEGALAYENATSRGNPLIKGTETQKMLKGKRLAFFAPENIKNMARELKEVEKVITGF